MTAVQKVSNLIRRSWITLSKRQTSNCIFKTGRLSLRYFEYVLKHTIQESFEQEHRKSTNSVREVDCIKAMCFLFFSFRFSLIIFCFFRFSLSTFRFSFFDIQNRAEYRILTFKIQFWLSKSGQISYCDIQNNILTFKLGPTIILWHSKSYFDIQNRAECRILTFKILFWFSNWGGISYFDN